jgi:translocation and assembly module TamB
LSDPEQTAAHGPRRRGVKILLWLAGIIVLLPIFLVCLVLLLANTGPGQRLIEGQVNSLTGGMVVLRGLSGRFPDSLRLAHAEIRDSQGAWISIDHLALDWSPSALAGGTAAIDSLTAERVSVPRLAVPAATPAPAKPASGGGFSLPVNVDLHALHIARLEIGAPLAGAAAAAKVDGDGAFASLENARANIAILRLDGPGTYRLNADLTHGAIHARLVAAEPQGGLLGGLAKLPALGALGLTAVIDGPRNALRTELKLGAGQLSANATGTVDLVGQALALDVVANAPAMSPRPDISWNSINAQAHVHGPFKTPDVSAHAVLQDVTGGGASLKALTLDATGNRGAVDAHTVIDGLTIPSAKPDLFANAPLDLTVHADLDQPKIPLRYKLTHILLTLEGTAQAGGDISAQFHTVIPDLAPLAALGKVDIRGRTEAVASMAVHGNDTDVTLDGTAEFTGGQAPVPTLLGHTTYGVTAKLAGQDIVISRALVDGKAAHLAVTGTDTHAGLDLALTLGLTDLAALSPQLRGALQTTAHASGPQTGLSLQADIKGDVGTATIAKDPLSVTIAAHDLPSKPAGTIEATGRFAGAPVSLSAVLVQQDDGGFHAVLKRAGWKSFSADADMVLAKGGTVPTGSFSARMQRLADLAPVIGQAIAGELTAKLGTTAPGAGAPVAKIDVRASHVSASGAAIGNVALTGTVRDPAGKQTELGLVLTADGIDAQPATGGARLTATGKLDALMLRMTSALRVSGEPATLSTQALLDLPQHKLALQALIAEYKGENLRLSAPAHIDFGSAVAVDRLRVALGAATLDVAGKISPALDLTASLHNVTPELAKPFMPTLQASGMLSADARLSGTAAAPQGTLRVQASGIRMRSGPAASLPAANVVATAKLQGRSAQIDMRADAGPKLHLAANGSAPLQQDAALAVHAAGRFDLSLLNPILNAGGRRAEGMMSLNADISGTRAAPRIDGAVTLAQGEIQDFAQGVRIAGITARLAEAGDTLRIESFSAKAGPGTMTLTGSIGVLAPGLPVDIHFLANNARPLSSDLLTAYLDADVFVKGQAAGNMQASGKIFVRKADINIPNGLPPSVAVLNVRRPGDKPPPPPASAPPATIDLAIKVDAPNSIFIRGHGLDSELGGALEIAGTAAAPQISGGFQMRRGSISVAGTTLNFSKGEVGFDGSSVTGKIDPTLNFAADSTSGSVTATLSVGGYADAPKITLSSVPDLPQDEVLAHLLFGESVKDLSAIQIAEIASALAELSGVTGGGGDPLGAVRKGLGLDRLSVGGGGSGSSGATVEAGRYVARGVYVGAKQATSGGGTAAEVQIDLTKRLKATAQLATGGGSVQGATPENDPGSTIGLSYQFEY